jgi:hypothetical protein
VRFDKTDRILHRHDLLGRIIRDLAPEFLLKGHYELDSVEAIGAQIVDEAGVFGYLGFVDTQMFDDDLLDPIGDVTHPFFSFSGLLEMVLRTERSGAFTKIGAALRDRVERKSHSVVT